MKALLLSACIAAGFAMTAGNASAQDRADFATLDANDDGALSLEELQNAGAARFAVADADGDGALSLDEMVAQAENRSAERVAKRAERVIARMDANDDGVLTLEEMQRSRADRAERMFERADADGDGAISAEEFDAMKGKKGRRGHGHGRG